MRSPFSLLFLFLFSTLTFTTDCFAQKNKTKARTLTADEAKAVNKDAGSMFKSGDYEGAYKGYKELIKTNSNNAEYNYRLGVSTLKTSVSKDKAYENLEIATKAKETPKDAWYYLGLAYMHAAMWDEAIEAFNTYKSTPNLKPNKDLVPTERMIEMAKNGKELTAHPVSAKFENMGKIINTPYEDFSPCVPADGRTLVFTSRRKGNLGGMVEEIGQYTADILWSQFRDTLGWTKGKSVGTYINTDWDEVVTSMSHDGNEIFTYFDNELAYGDLAVAMLKGRNWQAPIIMSINDPNSMESSACISNDGQTLYFSSDRKGTEGEFDLWYCTKGSAGEWSTPQNLGKEINTKYDESFPYISLDGKTLFFASQGHNSMGGYDIFYSTYDSASSSWSKPVNLGYPINTVDDDGGFSMVGNGKYGYIATVRPEGLGGRDIYKVSLTDVIPKQPAAIYGTVSGVTGGKVELRGASLTRKSDQKVVATYGPYYISNKYVLPAQPGTYILKVEGYGFQPIEEEITVDASSDDIVKNFSVTLAK